MKKTMIFILIILAFGMTSCSKRKGTEDTVKTTSAIETALSGKVSFNIIYELGDTAGYFTFTPTEAKAGDTVELKTEILIDADIHVYADDKEIDKTHYDSDYWGYSFVMPDKDVKITAKLYTQDEICGTEPVELSSLKENYPEYFGIDASEGLDVIVWQMARNSYSFGLLKHTGTERDLMIEELMILKGANAELMRKIISSYGIESKDVYIVPWQNPVSSYISEYYMVFEGEEQSDIEARKQEYIDNIRKMLFDDGMIESADEF